MSSVIKAILKELVIIFCTTVISVLILAIMFTAFNISFKTNKVLSIVLITTTVHSTLKCIKRFI